MVAVVKAVTRSMSMPRLLVDTGIGRRGYMISAGSLRGDYNTCFRSLCLHLLGRLYLRGLSSGSRQSDTPTASHACLVRTR